MFDPVPISTSPTPLEIAALVFVPLGAVSLLATVVYVDAKRNEVETPAKWPVIVVLTGGLGIALYVVEREPTEDPASAGPRTLPGVPAERSIDESADSDTEVPD